MYSIPNVSVGTVDASDLNLENSPIFGLRLGHYFSEGTSLGFEVDASYSTPNFVQQDVYMTWNNTANYVYNNSNYTIPKGFVAAEHQLPAQFHGYTASFVALYRYEIAKNIRPYLGVGPSLNYIDIEGSGDSGFHFVPYVSSGYISMPYMRSHGWGIGVLAKAGIEWEFTPGYALTAEYRYSRSDMNIAWFRSFIDDTTVYSSNAVTLGVLKKF